MRRRKPEPLKVEQAVQLRLLSDDPDEFHPDPRVAALYADQKANDAVQRWLTDEIRRLTTQHDLDPTKARKALLEGRVTQLAQAVDDRNEIDERIEEAT